MVRERTERWRERIDDDVLNENSIYIYIYIYTYIYRERDGDRGPVVT